MGSLMRDAALIYPQSAVPEKSEKAKNLKDQTIVVQVDYQPLASIENSFSSKMTADGGHV
jgi:hypothetical protein